MRDKAFRLSQKHKDKKVKKCSCWMCGSDRKYGKGEFRLTLQERKANEQNLQGYSEMEDEEVLG